MQAPWIFALQFFIQYEILNRIQKIPTLPKRPKLNPGAKESEMMMQQMKKMFAGMKIAMAIEVAGSVIKTLDEELGKKLFT